MQGRTVILRPHRPWLAQTRVSKASDTRKDSIGSLLLVFYSFLLIEGILRKWVVPGLQQPLIFIREPVLLLIYYQYFINQRNASKWQIIWFVSLVIFSLFGLAQVAGGIIPLAVFPIGIRNYLLYIPLCFIMAEKCQGVFIRKIINLALITSLPIAILVIIQFKLPPSSILNKGTADGAKGIILVGENIVRPYGPFTFAQAQNTYAVMMVAFSLIAWERRRVTKSPRWLILAATLSAFSMGALSGGRTFFGGAIFVAASYFISSFTTRSAGLATKRIFLIGGAVAAFVTIFVVVFPDSFTVMSNRQQRAVQNEGSTTARGISMMTLAADAVEVAPTFGHGMGMGSNVGAALANSSSSAPVWTLGEYDWPRIIQELGPGIGISYLMFRLFMFLFLGWAALKKNYRSSDNTAMIMFGFSGYLVLTAQVVGQSQLLSFCWFTCGLTLALAKPSTLSLKAPALTTS